MPLAPEWLQSAGQFNGVTTFDLTEPGQMRVKHPTRATPLSKA